MVENKKVSINVPIGTYTLTIEKEGHNTIVEDIDISDNSEMSFIATEKTYVLSIRPSHFGINIIVKDSSENIYDDLEHMKPGSYTVIGILEKFKKFEQEIEITNDDYVLDMDMEEIEDLGPAKMFNLTVVPETTEIEITKDLIPYENNKEIYAYGEFNIKLTSGEVSKETTITTDKDTASPLNIKFDFNTVRNFKITCEQSDASIAIKKDGRVFKNNNTQTMELGTYTVTLTQADKTRDFQIEVTESSPAEIVKHYDIDEVEDIKRKFNITVDQADATISITKGSLVIKNNETMFTELGDFTIVITKEGYTTINDNINIIDSSPAIITKQYTMEAEGVAPPPPPPVQKESFTITVKPPKSRVKITSLDGQTTIYDQTI